jgi:hypothetical protein
VVDPQQLLLKIDILNLHRQQFTSSDAAGEQGFQNGSVPNAFEAKLQRLRQNGFNFAFAE